ncbi:MAG TPA: L-seryl-tRNA(Sec) selenium transferase [Vicinamibacterales bacterium]|jgi:L-seryl-tRNA(Ser) seleniumtransferase|nr:L-seryl-tRNA(Sec) selenium transferase [Vicinamibacterales bacterium]
MSGFRSIPSIEALRQREAARRLDTAFGSAATVDALRIAADEVRAALRQSDPVPATDEEVVARIEAAAARVLEERFRPSLVPVINATGVILHTNLGRAPLAAAAIARVGDIASGYSNLEYDVARGARGRRDAHAERLLCSITGAEAAVVVNNNAAATLVVLAALAAGREVIVSRGELVEIGGGFRVPDVMAQSGAVLREVGTTNRTRASDYAAAIGGRTALLLRVHPSNFTLDGFVERPSLAELVAVGRSCGVPVAEDLGSGWLGAGAAGAAPSGFDEPSVAASLAAGVDVCCFSGDKLLGGPQAGLILGRVDCVTAIRTHPLMRAVRAGKMTYAALEATLAEYAAGRSARTIPVHRMLATPADAVRDRAATLARRLGGHHGWTAELVTGRSAVGGGSAPGVALPTWLLALQRHGLSPDALDARLRASAPPVVARIEADRVVLDLRTVDPADDEAIAGALEKI